MRLPWTDKFEEEPSITFLVDETHCLGKNPKEEEDKLLILY